MSQLTARVVANFAATMRPNSTDAGVVDLQSLTELYYGEDGGQANVLCRAVYAIDAEDTLTINLSSWIGAKLPGGGDAEIGELKALYIRNDSTNGDPVAVVGGLAPPLAGAAVPLMRSASILLSCGPDAGWVVSSPDNTITIENTSTTHPATVEIAALGVAV